MKTVDPNKIVEWVKHGGPDPRAPNGKRIKLNYQKQGGTPDRAPTSTVRYSHNHTTKVWDAKIENGKMRYVIPGYKHPRSKACSLDDDPRPSKDQRRALRRAKR